MNEKQKAKELVDRFNNNVSTHFTNMSMTSSIQCALICVDEILDIDMFDMSEELFEQHCEYWQKVKEEINKL